MKRLTILMTMLMATSVWSYNESDLLKLSATNQCQFCDLSGADLTNSNIYFTHNDVKLQGANLSNANLKGARLIGANLSNANLSVCDPHC